MSQLKIGNAISPQEKETEISTKEEQNEFELGLRRSRRLLPSTRRELYRHIRTKIGQK